MEALFNEAYQPRDSYDSGQERYRDEEEDVDTTHPVVKAHES